MIFWNEQQIDDSVPGFPHRRRGDAWMAMAMLTTEIALESSRRMRDKGIDEDTIASICYPEWAARARAGTAIRVTK
jgi:hypothetical protein